jgi:hypothetical protein
MQTIPATIAGRAPPPGKGNAGSKTVPALEGHPDDQEDLLCGWDNSSINWIPRRQQLNDPWHPIQIRLPAGGFFAILKNPACHFCDLV